MNLIESYISEVTRRLPKKMREDIELELRSTIEDMLPDDFTDEDVKNVLMKLGDPAKMANEYHAKPRYIIGPLFYETYINVLIVAATFSVVINCIVLFVNGIFTFDGETSVFTYFGGLLLKILLSSLNNLAYVFFWVTIVFTFLEHAGVSTEKVYTKRKPWTPDELVELQKVKQHRQIPKCEVFFSLFWTVLWATILLNASDLLGWYEQTGKGLEGLRLETQLFNGDVLLMYAPYLILLILIEVGLAIYKFFIARWTKQLASLNMLYHFFSVGLLLVMLNDSALFNEKFIKIMTTSFKINLSWLTFTIVCFMILASILDIFSGFNKASKAPFEINQIMKH